MARRLILVLFTVIPLFLMPIVVSQTGTFLWWVFLNGNQPAIYVFTGSLLPIDVGWINQGGCFYTPIPLHSELSLIHLMSPAPGLEAKNFTVETLHFDDRQTRLGEITLDLPGFSDSNVGPIGLWIVHMTLSGPNCNGESEYSFYVISPQDRRNGMLWSDQSAYHADDDPIVSWNGDCARLPGAVGFLQWSLPNQAGYHGAYQMTESEMNSSKMRLKTDFNLISLYVGQWQVSIVIVNTLASNHCWSNSTALTFQVLPSTTTTTYPTMDLRGIASSYVNGHLVVLGEVLNTGNVPIVNMRVATLFTDSTGQTIGGTTNFINGTVLADYLPPGVSSPFIIQDSTGKAVGFNSLSYWTPEAATLARPQLLEIEGLKITLTSQKHLEISGKVLNNGSSPSDSTRIIISFYLPLSDYSLVEMTLIPTNPAAILPGGIASFDYVRQYNETTPHKDAGSYALFVESNQFTSAQIVESTGYNFGGQTAVATVTRYPPTTSTSSQTQSGGRFPGDFFVQNAFIMIWALALGILIIGVILGLNAMAIAKRRYQEGLHD